MNSLKPYLIRALYDWIVDNQCTPYLVVNADAKGLIAPMQYAEDGRILLNLRPQAVQGLLLGDSFVEFNARFGGTPMQVRVPVSGVLAIYARENGQGMVFDENAEGDDGDDTPPPEPVKETPTPRARPNLTVVK